MSRSVTRAVQVVSLVMIAAIPACMRDAIDWRDPVAAPPALATSADIEFDARGDLVARSRALIQVPRRAGQCAGSVRAARDASGEWYATWWAARADSTAEIVVSRSGDGHTWMPAIRVDTTDAGRIGCARPPPSIAVDAGVVHVVYAMTAREGPGIFASHATDHGVTFHSPVAVVYGEHIGLTAVAARGDRLVVAFEDPNTNPQRIGVAYSRTMGHPFQIRDVVSPPIEIARDPRVALGDSVIAVTWARGAADAPAPRLLRVGTLR